MRPKVRTHGGLAELAEKQYGVVSGDQLLGLGYSPRSIARGVETGRLHRIHRGVFAVGHTGLPDHGICLAGVLTRGAGALLSYGSAAWLWGLAPTLELPVEVSVPWRGHGRKAPHLHHCPALRAVDSTSHEGIPVTAVPRTLLDYASTKPRRLQGAVERAERLGLLDIDAVDLLLDEVRGHAGRKRLRLALAIYRDPAFTRSGGELRFLELMREAGLPRPRVNCFTAGYEVDFFWEEQRFAVELDGWEAHRTRAAFERDPRRHEDLKLAGIEMVRITGRRLARDPDGVTKLVRTLLKRRESELAASPA
jgi:hypothetical protein